MSGTFLRSFGMASIGAITLFPGLAWAAEGQPAPGEIGFQDSVTPLMDSIVSFHNGILLWTAVLISLLVLVLLAIVVLRFNDKANPVPSKVTHNTLIEIIWTVVPILILIVIAVPSFAVLTDQMTIPDGQRQYLGSNILTFGDVKVPAPALTIKATGNQWYWSYQYPDLGKGFDSNILSEADIAAKKPGEPRLLAVDNELVVPVNTTVRVEVVGSDVIHSFAVPSFGIKIDAVPGRLNETWFNARKTGIYYGQCSQLCGTNHAFMPIAVRVVTQEQYDAWVAAFKAGTVDDANLTLAAAK